MRHIKPMVICIWSGEGKPSELNDFLEPFVSELKDLLIHGVSINGYQLTVFVHCFVCDSPARAFIKATVNFNHRFGCQKCTLPGTYYSSMSRMSFERIPYTQTEPEQQLRTDHQFRNRLQAQHHRGYSILEELPIDMIIDFITSDSLHLLDLGVIKRYLLRWIFGEKRSRKTWSARTTLTINLLLSKFNMTKPDEIHRKIRSLNHIKFWKATEFHVFLCYVGCVLLKDFLSNDEYIHFLKLFCATTICSTDKYKSYLPKARELFNDFIEESKELYGNHSVTSNIHNLCHIVDEVEHFGELNSISAYEFENELYKIKKRIKQCDKPLQQISRRFSELYNRPFRSYNKSKNDFPKLNEKFVLTGNNLLVYRKIEFENFVLSKKAGNNMFLTKNHNIVIFEYAAVIEKKIFLWGSRLKLLDNFFVEPFSSRFLNIYISDCSKFDPEYFEISMIKAKLFSMPYKNQNVFIPLLHTIQ